MIGGTSRLHPPFGLDFEIDTSNDSDNSYHGSNSPGYRKGIINDN